MNEQTITQDQWEVTIDESEYTITAFCRCFSIPYSSLSGWLHRGVRPSAKNKKKMEEALSLIANQKKLPYHPSYGYATPEQIEQLRTLGIGPQRDYILREVEKQNAAHGKTFR